VQIGATPSRDALRDRIMTTEYATKYDRDVSWDEQPIAGIVAAFARRLRMQKQADNCDTVGEQLSAAHIFWAVLSNLVAPRRKRSTRCDRPCRAPATRSSLSNSDTSTRPICGCRWTLSMPSGGAADLGVDMSPSLDDAVKTDFCH